MNNFNGTGSGIDPFGIDGIFSPDNLSIPSDSTSVNGSWTTTEYHINTDLPPTDKFTIQFPEGKIELTYRDLKVMKRLIEKFGKELFPEEYV
jgi:hypothetical protein